MWNFIVEEDLRDPYSFKDLTEFQKERRKFVSLCLMGVCKKLRDLLDAILLFGNMLMIHKNTTRSRYVMLGLVNLEPDMSYDT